MRDISDDRDRQVGYREGSGQMRDGLRHPVELLDELRPVRMPATRVDVDALLRIGVMVMVMRGKTGRHHAEQEDESRRRRGAKLPVNSHTPTIAWRLTTSKHDETRPTAPTYGLRQAGVSYPSIDQPQGDISA